MSQVFNPFLPINEYIPDGEPHVFGDRVYHYGSHDREGGFTFCMDDYVTYSAPVDDLTNWRYEGVIYKASQDPDYDKHPYMYAPDVVQGNDGKYYLYYAMSGIYGQGGYTNTIHVAVCDTPCGQFEYLGEVKYKDGTPMWKYVCFDPAVMNDNGVIRLYYGTQYNFEEQDDFDANAEYVESEMNMFGRTREQILEYRKYPESCSDGKPGAVDSIMGAVGCTLEDDMLTIKDEPKHIIPYAVRGTDFEEHPFFEASSMRKVGDTYYFVYSSFQNHELCYATSKYPDHGFKFGGTIVSNGDVGYEGRLEKDKHNMTGTTHGSIIEINGQWYVFYHRLTHKSDYSRQACAEKITIEADGSIKQVEITSCGLNPEPLKTNGYEYPATIACIITNGHMPHGCNSIYKDSFPNVSHLGEDRFIAEICADTLIGYKYFDYKSVSRLTVKARLSSEKNTFKNDGPERIDRRSGSGNKAVEIENSYDDMILEVRMVEDGPVVGTIKLEQTDDWASFAGDVSIPDGVAGLFLTYKGNPQIQLLTISL
ncbi:MAG: family 43 glycosylhydrolase [Saccharofermentans sp.]|nr:family 43 glycosylhydrolase [Saccharofermentans sp.]